MSYLPKQVEVSAYEIPTDLPESDCTLEWDGITIVVVSARAASAERLGCIFAAAKSAATVIRGKLASRICSLSESRPPGKFAEKSQ